MSSGSTRAGPQEAIDLCSPPSPHPPPAKRLRGEQREKPHLKDLGAAAAAEDIIDLSLDSPHSGVEERSQPTGNQRPNSDQIGHRSLWGELAASQGSARPSHRLFENDLQLPQWRDNRRRRSPYIPPSVPPPAHYTAAAAAADSLTDNAASSGMPLETWSFLNPTRLRQSDDNATAAPQPQPRPRRRHFTPAAPTDRPSSPPPPPMFSSSLPSSPFHARYPTDDMLQYLSPQHRPSSRKADEDAAVARRLQQQEEIAAARAARATRFQEQQAAVLQRRLEEQALERRMEQLQALEEATQGWSEDDDDEAEAEFWGGGRYGGQRGRRAGIGSGRRRSTGTGASTGGNAGGGGQERDWPGGSLADAMMNMLSESGSWGNMHLPGGRGGPSFAGGAGTSRFGGSDLVGAIGAMRAALQGMASGSRLPPSLLFSDRDFNENDYEALLALDDGIENRKGASQDDIETLPTVVLSAAVTDTSQDTRCPICLEDYEAGATLRRMACGHQMHKGCLDTWLQQRAACPICQASAKRLKP